MEDIDKLLTDIKNISSDDFYNKKSNSKSKTSIFFENKNFTQEEIDKGVEYMQVKNLLESCINYQFDLSDKINKQIMNLDKFVLHDSSGWGSVDIKNMENNLSIIFDIDNLVTCGFHIGKYLYQVIKYIQDLSRTIIDIKNTDCNEVFTRMFLKKNQLIVINYYYDIGQYRTLQQAYTKCSDDLKFISEMIK